jgi:glutaredoxin
MKNHWSISPLGALCAAVFLLAQCGLAHSQTVYRIVGPNGKVTFSDKPPANPEQGKVAATGIGASGSAVSAALPFELRQVVSKYPVTLYSAAKCAPCDAGRGLLQRRGIPFTERTVNTQEDIDYFEKLAGDNSLPFLTIGAQRIKGLSESEWTQYLDAAGYPQASQLPANFKNAAPAPLVTPKKPEPAKPAEKPPAPVPEPVRPPVGPTPSNPAGIQF